MFKKAIRLGTKPVKCVFRIEVHRVTFAATNHGIEDSSQVSVCFERGDKRSSSPDTAVTVHTDGHREVAVGASLSLVVTMYKEESGKYQSKVGKLVVLERQRSNLRDRHRRLGEALVGLDEIMRSTGSVELILPLTHATGGLIYCSVIHEIADGVAADETASGRLACSDGQLNTSITEAAQTAKTEGFAALEGKISLLEEEAGSLRAEVVKLTSQNKWLQDQLSTTEATLTAVLAEKDSMIQSFRSDRASSEAEIMKIKDERVKYCDAMMLRQSEEELTSPRQVGCVALEHGVDSVPKREDLTASPHPTWCSMDIASPSEETLLEDAELGQIPKESKVIDDIDNSCSQKAVNTTTETLISDTTQIGDSKETQVPVSSQVPYTTLDSGITKGSSVPPAATSPDQFSAPESENSSSVPLSVDSVPPFKFYVSGLSTSTPKVPPASTSASVPVGGEGVGTLGGGSSLGGGAANLPCGILPGVMESNPPASFVFGTKPRSSETEPADAVFQPPPAPFDFAALSSIPATPEKDITKEAPPPAFLFSAGLSCCSKSASVTSAASASVGGTFSKKHPRDSKRVGRKKFSFASPSRSSNAPAHCSVDTKSVHKNNPVDAVGAPEDSSCLFSGPIYSSGSASFNLGSTSGPGTSTRKQKATRKIV